MVKITTSQDGSIEVSGKTYEHKALIKTLGAKWNSERKCWVGIKNTKEHMKVLKALTTKRSCGYCGEVGHFKPKCEKYHENRRNELVEWSAKICSEEGLKTITNFRRYKTQYCQCGFEDRDYGYKGFSVKMPVVCVACSNWCCSLARPEKPENGITFVNFTCSRHGSFMEQLLNDTRGT